MNALVKGTQQAIRRFEAALLQLDQVDLQTQHTLADGVYTRTIFVPAGVALTGAVHKSDYTVVMVGDITVTTDEGSKRLTGHHVFLARAGSKRAGFAHKDTWWTTIHRTDKTDLVAIEDDIAEEAELLQTRTPAIGCTPLLRLPEKI